MAAPPSSPLPPALRFLEGGGRATQLILDRDWTGHVLGPPESWPEALKVSLSLVLNSPESMILSWGHAEPDFFIFFNETYFPMLGPRLSWAMGAPFYEVWADAAEQARPIVQAAFAGDTARYVDLPWKLDTDRGAADTWWTFSYSRVLGADGKVAGLFIFTNETTEHVLDRRRVAEEEQRQRALLQQMPGFIAVLRGPLHIYDYVNDAYLTVAGDRDYIGRPVREVFPELAGQGFLELLDQVYATGERYVARGMPITLAGDVEARFLDFLYEPTRDDHGQVAGIFVGGYETTEAYRTLTALSGSEAALRDSEARLREANEFLEANVEARTRDLMQAEEALRQAQKMEAVGQLTGGIAHDFNNLLAGIMGSLEMLQMRLAQGRAADVDRYVDAAQTSARRAAALTQRLLAFSRRQTLDPKPTDVNRLVGGMEDMIRRSVGPGVAVAVAGAADLWTTRVDPSQLENALLNLCINARDAMAPGGGQLTIETANRWLDEAVAKNQDLQPGPYVCLSVIDTGAGMTAEVIARAFDPFFTTKPLGQGTGLGLSMVYGFVRQSGGQVGIDSAPGDGTTLTLYLPRYQGALDGEAEGDADGAQPVGHGETVLVIDDDTVVRMLVVDVLTENGYAVLEAFDGPSGLAILNAGGPIDLLVTDVGLPGGMNGRQIADAARVARPGLKVLFITGYAENAVVGDGRLDVGMEIITKPFSAAALNAKIGALIAADA